MARIYTPAARLLAPASLVLASASLVLAPERPGRRVAGGEALLARLLYGAVDRDPRVDVDVRAQRARDRTVVGGAAQRFELRVGQLPLDGDRHPEEVPGGTARLRDARLDARDR